MAHRYAHGAAIAALVGLIFALIAAGLALLIPAPAGGPCAGRPCIEVLAPPVTGGEPA